MTRFSATTFSEATVPASRDDIWALLTDPDALVRLTPLLRRIETDGDIWCWHLIDISALGVSISPSFTEQMTFVATELISYVHQPPAGTTERQGADGRYELAEVAGGTHLAISLTLHIDLPLSGLARPAVTRIMNATMQRTGDRFSANMLHELGITPSAFPA